jgi:hypothetical protein
VGGEVAGRLGVERRVADQQAVPEHAVSQVDEHAEIGRGGDIAAGHTPLEQGPQGRAALRGELGEHPGRVLVVDGGGRQLTQHAPGARVLQAGEAVREEAPEVLAE